MNDGCVTRCACGRTRAKDRSYTPEEWDNGLSESQPDDELADTGLFSPGAVLEAAARDDRQYQAYFDTWIICE